MRASVAHAYSGCQENTRPVAPATVLAIAEAVRAVEPDARFAVERLDARHRPVTRVLAREVLDELQAEGG